MQLRGVNLGNWLVLEKWMNEALFWGTDAEDETYLCADLGFDRARERLTIHREEFISERDFEDIAARGFNAVRIPVPFYLFEDVGPYIHCVEYLDRAFDWAEKYGLWILAELHSVPGGHNGTDNSGICGIRTWSTRKDYVDFTLDVLERMAKRYGSRPALWGIGVLNEPMCEDTDAGSQMTIENFVPFYKPADEKLAAENANYSLAFLQQFYRDAYERIRRHMGPEKKVVFSDAFELEIWDEFLKDFEGVVLDTHNYLMTADRLALTERNADTYRSYLRALGERVNAAGERLPLIVGEWNVQHTADGREEMPQEELDALYRMISEEFQAGMTTALGWFYWSWKVIADGFDAPCDDAMRCCIRGYITKEDLHKA